MRLRTRMFLVAGVAGLAVSCKGFDASRLGGAALERTGLASKRAEENCKKLEVDPTVEEEYAIGSAMAINWVQRGGGLLHGDGADALHRYLNIVGKNLAAQSARPTLEWTFGVIDDTKSFNAVSAPGGYVFVTRKLLANLENEGQLAGVLAHEISHVVLKHTIEKYNSSKVSLCKTAMITDALVPGSGQLVAGGKDGHLDLDGDPALLGNAAESTLNYFDKGNNKEQEFKADQMAIELMLSAGYDPEDYRRLIAKTTEDTVQPNHPSKTERVKKMVAFLDTLRAKKEDAFAGLSTEGVHSPPLKQPEYAIIRPAPAGVAKDGAK
ncbi:M48 family metalloprotease [Pyxidicoccus parkwayensis]|uniref:M48 family metalloprotease n=1 Tax=Pyxidicoccus parkwayensis TaxID=2813578 RepID=A0ABX7NP78_9BACT|nr:M48 family metalloprotease [Pyxidicoccus parkwaysis]QSQ20670.1 M48 family metalloprotease [Pyxidicoccus parkwaysis]